MIRDAVKHATPQPARVLYHRIRLYLDRRRNAGLELADVSDRVYARGDWGGGDGEFVSGSGSNDAQTTDYVAAVVSFIRSHNIRTLVDAGCGDFRVARRILDFCSGNLNYVGVDIVQALIDRNQALFGSERVQFVCKDITRDQLPSGDLCLVRQVLQHLSNSEIVDALASIKRYRYALVSEHYPAPELVRVPNRDKPHGGDTRVVDGSGVFLGAAPFGIMGAKLFHEADVISPLVREGETIRTWLIERSV